MTFMCALQTLLRSEMSRDGQESMVCFQSHHVQLAGMLSFVLRYIPRLIR
jgi:hypothetical protein